MRDSHSLRAVIFDCDGVLADTERDGHLVAFNRMFQEFHLPVHWSLEDYREKLRTAGGKERLTSLLTAEFVSRAKLPEEPSALRAEVERWHVRKTELFRELVAAGTLPPRSGVARLAREALGEGLRLAVASTSSELSVRTVLERAVGREVAGRFAVFAGDVVARKKPAPDIYALALRELGVRSDEAVVIEDSAIGLAAAVAAGVTCVVTVSSLTAHESFEEAVFVVSSLGDPDGEQSAVIADASGQLIGGWVTLADLRAALRVGTAAQRGT